MSIFVLARCAHWRPLARLSVSLPFVRGLHATSTHLNVTQKYLDKVQKRAEEQGVSVDELKQRIAKAARTAPLPEAQRLQTQARKREANAKTDGGSSKAWAQSVRRDNSPAKPLAEIMDIHKVLRKPHTAEQISVLWTAFHASRSGGTGRGYLSAAVPLQTYESLVSTGKQYPNFIMPLMREASQANPSEDDSAKEKSAYEFFYMQWAFHATPPVPAPSILDPPLPDGALPPPPVHPLATILFTPLLEYKMRATFAAPHLVLTMYPDLSQSHKLVLLRGELTPSPAGTGRYMLSQQDAQLLALGFQRFYLAGGEEKDESGKERAELLRVFNESPSEFRWEHLLKHANPTS